MTRQEGEFIGKCHNCNKEYTRSQMAFTERKVEDDLFEIGLECPGCKTWYHSYYLSTELQEQREALQRLGEKITSSSFIQNVPITAAAKKRYEAYEKAHSKYQSDYIIFQHETRASRGASVPQVKETKNV